jgi:flagellar biosynthesis regulator FlaF
MVHKQAYNKRKAESAILNRDRIWRTLLRVLWIREKLLNKVLKSCLIGVCVLAVVSAASAFAYSKSKDFKAFADKFDIYKQIQIYMFEQADIWGNCVKNEDFNARYEDFLTVAQVAEKYIDEAEKTGNRCLLLEYDQQSKKYNLYYLIIGSKNERVELSNQEQKSLSSVDEAFKSKDARLDGLRVFKNRISFETDNGQYTLVYSIDDSKPTFLNLPGKDPNFYVRKIRDHWYHVVNNPR